MKRQRIFFMVDSLVFEVDKPEIYLEQLRVMELDKNDEENKPGKENDDGILSIIKKV